MRTIDDWAKEIRNASFDHIPEIVGRIREEALLESRQTVTESRSMSLEMKGAIPAEPDDLEKIRKAFFGDLGK